MTGPDDAFLAPDDTLRDGAEGTVPGVDDVPPPAASGAPGEDEVEDGDPSGGEPEQG